MKTQTSMRGAVTVGPTESKKKLGLWDSTALLARSRPRRHWDFGEQHADLMRSVFPGTSQDVRRKAAATCRICVMGKDAVTHNGSASRRGSGRWVYTRMQTEGHRPNTIRWSVQKRIGWVEGNSFDAADDVLGCFGLSIEDVISHFGSIDENERFMVDLVDIVAELSPVAMVA